jgi:hypothetical protein
MQHLKSHRLFELLIVKLALTWVATIQSDAIKIRACHAFRLVYLKVEVQTRRIPLYVYNMSLFLVVCLLNR